MTLRFVFRAAVAATFAGIACLSLSRPGVAAKACGAAARSTSIFYVTNRERATDRQLFDGERALDRAYRSTPSYGLIDEPVGPATLVPCTSRSQLVEAMKSRFVAAAGPQVLIYVHGFYTTFVQAATDALDLQKQLRFRGPVILYSWPAKKTSRLAYFNDETNAEWSNVAFRDMLAGIERTFPKATFSFATHSLGSRFAADGMSVLRRIGCASKCFGRALLFASDVDSDTLREELGELGLCSGPPSTHPTASAPVTLYVSNRDTALRQSQKLHGHQRAGQAASEIILCSGVDTIDVGYRKFDDPAGHSYQADPRMVRDAAAAFSGISPADATRGLRRVTRGSSVYYELR